mgnify:FL=1
MPYALFREQEDTQGYLLLLHEIIQHKGIPLALYSDRHGIFQRSPKDSETVEEQLAGTREPTQFGRAIKELGIQNIFARSPQAKGRIERLWGTFQDRLVAELRLAGACTLAEANNILTNFLPRFNERFGVPAAQPGFAYRLPEAELDLESVLCFKYQRTVARDNTIRFGGHTLQLLPGLDRLSYAQARVELQERLDGSLVVTYQDQTIATSPAPPTAPLLRARSNAHRATPSPPTIPSNNGPRPHVPSPDHPWRKPLLLTKSQNN